MNIFRMFLYYITPATTKQVEELKRQRDALLKYKYDSRRSLRSLQKAYMLMRADRDTKRAITERQRMTIDGLLQDKKALTAAFLPEQETTSGARG